MKENKNNKCHSQKFLLGISRIRFRKGMFGRLLNTGKEQMGDPRQQSSGMTNQNNCHADGNQHLQRLSWSLRNSLRGRFQIKFGMTPLLNSSAFTLIELLVVVLIIGILAAIALPQYQKAVEKSRAAEALTLLKSVYQASNLYYLEHGRWPTRVSQLDVKIPWTRAQNWYAVGTYQPGVSNGEWSMQLIRNSAGAQSGVSIGRLTGPYAGIAFEIHKVPPSKKVPADKLICIEGPEREYVLHKFKKSKGSYCQRIWGGTELPSGISWGMNYFVVK